MNDPVTGSRTDTTIALPELVKMMKRSGTAPNGEVVRGAQRACNIGLRRFDRLDEIEALSEQRSNRGGERAACSMRILRRNTLSAEGAM